MHRSENAKALIDSDISHNVFVLINNVIEKSYDMKERIKNSNKPKFKCNTILLFKV